MAGATSGDTALGAAIRSARERVGWPQARLAQDAGYGQTWLSAIETGARGIDPRDLAKVASVLGVSVDSLLGGEEVTGESPFMLAMRNYDASLDERGRRTVIQVAAAQAEEAMKRAGLSEEEAALVVAFRAAAPAAQAAAGRVLLAGAAPVPQTPARRQARPTKPEERSA